MNDSSMNDNAVCINDLLAERGSAFQALHARLQAALKAGGGAPVLDNEDVEYWAERFTRLHIRFWTGFTFDRYLSMVLVGEVVAAQNRRAARARGVRHCTGLTRHALVHRGAIWTLIVSLN